MGTTRGFIRSCQSLSQWPSQNAQDIAKSREWTTDQLKAELKIPDLLFNAWIEGDTHWGIKDSVAFQDGGRENAEEKGGEGLAALENSLELMESEVLMSFLVLYCLYFSLILPCSLFIFCMR